MTQSLPKSFRRVPAPVASVCLMALFMGRTIPALRSEFILALAPGNVVYEFFLPILNTRDPVDAL